MTNPHFIITMEKIITIKEGEEIPKDAKYLGTTFEYVQDYSQIPESGGNIPLESYPKKKIFYHAFIMEKEKIMEKENKPLNEKTYNKGASILTHSVKQAVKEAYEEIEKNICDRFNRTDVGNKMWRELAKTLFCEDIKKVFKDKFGFNLEQ